MKPPFQNEWSQECQLVIAGGYGVEVWTFERLVFSECLAEIGATRAAVMQDLFIDRMIGRRLTVSPSYTLLLAIRSGAAT